jgi:hypothetical protein
MWETLIETAPLDAAHVESKVHLCYTGCFIPSGLRGLDRGPLATQIGRSRQRAEDLNHSRAAQNTRLWTAPAVSPAQGPCSQEGTAEAVTDPQCMPVACVARPVLTGTAFDLLKGLRPSLKQAHALQHDVASRFPRVARVSRARVSRAPGDGVPLLLLGQGISCNTFDPQLYGRPWRVCLRRIMPSSI